MINQNIAVPITSNKNKYVPVKETIFTLIINKDVYKNTEAKLY